MASPLETFADVLHRLIDEVVHDEDEATQAHQVIDQSSGTRTADPAASAPADSTPSETSSSTDNPASSMTTDTGLAGGSLNQPEGTAGPTA